MTSSRTVSRQRKSGESVAPRKKATRTRTGSRTHDLILKLADLLEPRIAGCLTQTVNKAIADLASQTPTEALRNVQIFRVVLGANSVNIGSRAMDRYRATRSNKPGSARAQLRDKAIRSEAINAATVWVDQLTAAAKAAAADPNHKGSWFQKDDMLPPDTTAQQAALASAFEGWYMSEGSLRQVLRAMRNEQQGLPSIVLQLLAIRGVKLARV